MLIGVVAYLVAIIHTLGEHAMDLVFEHVDTEIQFDLNPIKKRMFPTKFPKVQQKVA